MKKFNLFLTAVAASMMMTSCAGGNENETAEHTDEASEAHAGEVSDWTIDTEKSSVRWEGGTSGAKVYSHFGQIKIKEGKLSTEGDMVKQGNIVIDMSTIVPQDEGYYSEEHPASDLVGHLSSPDFFDIANHPSAAFQVTGIEGNQVKGQLTVRGITHEEIIMLDAFAPNEDGTAHIAGNLNFDRQKYDVKWAHYLQDVILSDNIMLQFDIIAKKA
jgi:polyisoprenoid-binding protein YceI